MEENKKHEVHFISEDFILPFRPFELNHKYLVMYTIKKGEVIQTLEQNFSLRRLRPDTKQNDYHFIEVDKISELLIDGKPIDNKVYIVAEKTAQLLYPLRIVVNKYGKWIDLNSYDKLKERWGNQKEDIKESFGGKIFEMLAKNIEDILSEDKTLVKFISSNWFLRAFFNGIHTVYTRKFKTEKKLYFPAIAEVEDIEFLITQSVNPYLNELNQIEVMQKGELEDEFRHGSYSANYILNPNNYIIEKIELKCNMEMALSRQINISVRNLDEGKIILDSEISLIV
jgi:hypothetical protein